LVRVTSQTPSDWLVLLVQVPASPSRHRVAVWRELRKSGAVPIVQGSWAAPDVAESRAAADRAQQLARDGGGEVFVLHVASATSDVSRLQSLFDDARQEEWTEFVADCGKFTAEIAREIERHKFTFAELEEEEQSLERLRRWYRAIRAKDINAVSGAADAEKELATCVAELDRYAAMVYEELHT
jgi:hypothetical protein